MSTVFILAVALAAALALLTFALWGDEELAKSNRHLQAENQRLRRAVDATTKPTVSEELRARRIARTIREGGAA